ncbi:methyltransferase domain-containing protein [Shewanella sp. YLB-09]|nr:methyltransferase domain-containing protein [Shewanella sp. YLB-09]
MKEGVAQSVNDQTVAQRFSAAAKHYHDFDRIQKMSSRLLFEKMSPHGTLLDIGAGPGTNFGQFTSVKKVIALDIAQGMLDQLSQDFPEYQTLCANAQSIPLPNDSVNSAYSNLALQWCSDLGASINETARVLKHNGEYHLAVVAKDSLLELSDLGFRVNGFRSIDEILSHFDNKQQWQIISAETKAVTVYFPQLKSLLYSIKGVGASIHANDQSSQGIRGRGDWVKLLSEAEKSRTPNGLPLTYQIALISAKRIV